MSIPPPPPALLGLTRKAVSLLGNGSGNKYIFWQLPQCNITSNPYGGVTGTYGLINCLMIKYGAVSVVVWFYLPPGGTGTLISYQTVSFPNTPPYGWSPLIYIGTDGQMHMYDCCGASVSSPISPGWHMAVFEEWAVSTSGPYYIAGYLDGNFIGQQQITIYPAGFGVGMGPHSYNYIGTGYAKNHIASNNTWFFFNGAIAYVALYNRLLSPSDAMSIYQGGRVANGLVAEYVGDNYDPLSGVWIDDVGGNNAYVVLASPPEVVDLVTTEFTSGINYELLAKKIAEGIAGKPLNIANLPINQYGNLNISMLDQWGYPYIDLNGIANNPLKNWFKVLSNASITSNGSTGNYGTGPYRNFLVTIYVGSVSGTSPSLTVYFNAYDSNSGQSIPLASVNITSAGAYYISVSNFPGNQFNISWTVGGTSPSFGSVYISVYESW